MICLLSNIDQVCTGLASFQRETILLAFVYLDRDYSLFFSENNSTRF